MSGETVATFRRRSQRLTRTLFFALFVLAPPLDLLRLDLNLGHAILFGHDWTLGLAPLQRGELSPGAAVWGLLWRVFLPALAVVFGVLWIACCYGRLYCGWLCPHFSVVETINSLMRRASGKPTLWERRPLPERRPDGSVERPRRLYWLAVAAAVIGFSLLWAVTLLTYLVTPGEVYSNLFNGALTAPQQIFLLIATAAFVIEFTAARHLFCRYGCAVGLFQSLAWMANDKALLVGYDRRRAKTCADCNNACDNACPMRLRPRAPKRHVFTCTQCSACISACEQVQAANPQGPLLRWVQGEAARQSSVPRRVRRDRE